MREPQLQSSAAQEIDFLPASFHQKRRAAGKRSGGVLLGASLSLIVVGSVRQFQVRNDRLASLEATREQAAALKESLGDPAALKARIEQLDRRANLVTRLRIRIAPTSLLAGVTATRPEFVSFQEFRMIREAVTGSVSPTRPPAGVPPETVPPEQRDLERLAREAAESAVFVHISGLAPDDVTLSRYLIALEETKLFDEVKLLFADEHRHREFPLRSFRLRLRVRSPGAANAGTESVGDARKIAGLREDRR